MLVLLLIYRECRVLFTAGVSLRLLPVMRAIAGGGKSADAIFGFGYKVAFAGIRIAGSRFDISRRTALLLDSSLRWNDR